MAQLPRRLLGSTGLEVSVLGFGASPLGSVFEDVKEADGVAAVHEAFRLGINLFDTSPFYGATKSEAMLGNALKGLPRDQIVISTKVGRYGPELFDFSAERVTASVHESLARLQTGYIDIIQCHDVEFGDLDQVVSETLPALAALKAKGLVRFVGVTGLPLGVFPYILDRAPPGSVDVVLSYCHHSLNDSSLSQLLPYLRSKGVGVINASPLSMGLLTKRGPPDWHPAPPEVKAACAAAAEHCASQGLDVSALALKWALRNPDVSTTLVGMASTEVVRANVESAMQALGADAADEEIAAREARALKEVERILAPVKDVSWASGRPENNGLPLPS